MKPKALILDDNPQRHTLIVRDNPEFDYHSSLDIWNAQEIIKAEPFDILFLDFDLNDFSDASSIVTDDITLPLTGADFLAYMLTETPQENWPKKVIIVSVDNDGAKEMQWLLDQVAIPTVRDPLPN